MLKPGTKVLIESKIRNYSGKFGEVISELTNKSVDLPAGYVYSSAYTGPGWYRVKFIEPYVCNDTTVFEYDIFPEDELIVVRDKIVIAGIVGSGKTTLAKHLQKKGLRLAKSYTTRPRRKGEGDDYYFISKEDAAEVDPRDKMLGTVYGDSEYFMTATEVRRSDIFILEPDGVNSIIDKFPEYDFTLIYVKPESLELAEKMHDSRDPGSKKFSERYALGKERFDKLESSLEDKTFKEKFKEVRIVVNDYTDDFLHQFN